MRENLSRDDWDTWLKDPVTQVFYEAVKDEQETAKQILVKSVDMDSLVMAKYVGIMSGLQKVLEIEYDTTRE